MKLIYECKQCPAVKIQLLFNKEPPQWDSPSRVIATVHGQAPILLSRPPTILFNVPRLVRIRPEHITLES